MSTSYRLKLWAVIRGTCEFIFTCNWKIWGKIPTFVSHYIQCILAFRLFVYTSIQAKWEVIDDAAKFSLSLQDIDDTFKIGKT